MFFLFHDPDDVSDYGTSLIKLGQALNSAREVAPDISVSTLATFVAIVKYGKDLASMKKTLPQIAEEMGIPYARLMRHLDVLSDGTPTAPGHNLLDKIMDPRSKRNRKFKPSHKGDELIKKMLMSIEFSRKI